MKIVVQATKIDLTPSIEVYIEQKLGSLARFVKRFDDQGQPELRVEIARTTRHHRHGAVFMAEGNLRLPQQLLRGEAYHEDIRAAIDGLRKTLRLEIEKYKTKHSAKPRVKNVY